MRRRSAATKLPAAFNRDQRRARVRDDAGQQLLEAIRNSATSMDQIVSRRIGLGDAPPKKLK